ncbi:hypothetical protein NE237_009571 [Protea cynaroides]|uniref:Uncharacterized protein n=1 Tax=Protea cynaroides TaxID=273540 RepID=A0A9Q0KY28_9MAGN|nr:hypothetical protein NE237_009571 [Protea cynaroides]
MTITPDKPSERIIRIINLFSSIQWYTFFTVSLTEFLNYQNDSFRIILLLIIPESELNNYGSYCTPENQGSSCPLSENSARNTTISELQWDRFEGQIKVGRGTQSIIPWRHRQKLCQEGRRTSEFHLLLLLPTQVVVDNKDELTKFLMEQMEYDLHLPETTV